MDCSVSQSTRWIRVQINESKKAKYSKSWSNAKRPCPIAGGVRDSGAQDVTKTTRVAKDTLLARSLAFLLEPQNRKIQERKSESSQWKDQSE